MEDSYLGQMNIRKDCIELAAEDAHPVRFAPRHVKPEAQDFYKSETDKAALWIRIRPAQTGRAVLLVIASNND